MFRNTKVVKLSIIARVSLCNVEHVEPENAATHRIARVAKEGGVQVVVKNMLAMQCPYSISDLR